MNPWRLPLGKMKFCRLLNVFHYGPMRKTKEVMGNVWELLRQVIMLNVPKLCHLVRLRITQTRIPWHVLYLCKSLISDVWLLSLTLYLVHNLEFISVSHTGNPKWFLVLIETKMVVFRLTGWVWLNLLLSMLFTFGPILFIRSISYVLLVTQLCMYYNINK